MRVTTRQYLGAVFFVLCAMAACKPNSADLPVAAAGNARISYFNLVPQGNAINLYLNGTRQNGNKIAYNEYSGYILTPSGERSLSFKTDSLRNTLFEPVTFDLAPDYTTIFVTGNSASNIIYARDTAVTDSKNIKPKLRFINASANSPAYDVTLNNVTISNTAYKGISAFARVDTGKVVTVNVKLAGSAAVLLSKNLTLQSSRVYTLFIYGKYNTVGVALNLGVIANK